MRGRTSERQPLDLGDPTVSTRSERLGPESEIFPTVRGLTSEVRPLDPIRPVADQRQEFRARFLFFAEAAQHGRSHGGGVLLFDSAHHHAEMPRFNHDAYSLRFDRILDGFCDLRGQTLLNLQPAEKISIRRGILLKPMTLPLGM